MRKLNILIICLISLVILSTFVIALSSKNVITECKKNCSINKINESKICLDGYKECRQVCSIKKKDCLDKSKNEFITCKNNCSNLTGNNKRQCLMDCAKNKIQKNVICSKQDCIKNCQNISFFKCKKNALDLRVSCQNNCLSQEILSQQQCNLSGGFFQEICNGPYFDIICSKSKYCICDGTNQYKCPTNYTCNHDIKNLLPRKSNTIQGYKDFLGNDLGNIGICEKSTN